MGLEVEGLLDGLLEQLVGVHFELADGPLRLVVVVAALALARVAALAALGGVLLLLEVLVEAIVAGTRLLLFSILATLLLLGLGSRDDDRVRHAHDRVVDEDGVGLLEDLEVLDVLDLEEHLLDLLLSPLDLVAAAAATPLSPAVLHIFKSHGLCHGVDLSQNTLVPRLHRRDYAQSAAQEGP